MKIDNFSDYEIFPEEGKVWSYKSNRYIGTQHHTGYWQVGLYDDNGEKHYFLLHRLVWMAVHGDIPQNYEINHIDEDKSNCSIFNLSLCTHKENVNYGTGNERRSGTQKGKPKPTVSAKLKGRPKPEGSRKPSKQVAAYKNDVLVMIFTNASEAGRNGFNYRHVSECCNGKRQSHKGYQWRFLN